MVVPSAWLKACNRRPACLIGRHADPEVFDHNLKRMADIGRRNPM
jgi:hypothetical protein